MCFGWLIFYDIQYSAGSTGQPLTEDYPLMLVSALQALAADIFPEVKYTIDRDSISGKSISIPGFVKALVDKSYLKIFLDKCAGEKVSF